MQLLLTDLDNTLIYSHRRDIGVQREHVEWYEGKQISFMTRKSQQLLELVRQKLLVIPCTTRSIAQYQRIQLLPAWRPLYAFMANGGVLLVNGRIEPQWYQESLDRIASAESALQQAQVLLERHTERLLPVKCIDGLFLYTKSSVPEQLRQQLEAVLDLDQVQVLLHGAKVYVMPHTLTKGAVVQRIRQRYPQSYIWAAGDSTFDVPMLQAADFAFAPEKLASHLSEQSNQYLVSEGQLLAEEMLQYLQYHI
ncbi:MAG: hypothetical protein ACLUKQ_05715 [Peptococcaceae bacterium]